MTGQRGSKGKPTRNMGGKKRQAARKRRQQRIARAAAAWILCIGAVVLLAVGVVRLTGYIAGTKVRQLRAHGIEQLEQGNYQGAIEQLDQALASLKKDTGAKAVDLLAYRAEAEYRLEDYGAALHTYELLTERDEGQLEYWYMGSRCAALDGQAEKAVTLYSHVTEAEQGQKKKTEGRLETLMAVCSACIDQELYEEAQRLCEEALADGLEEKEVYNQLGLCQMAGQDYENAADTFDQGLSAAGEDQELLKELTYNRALCSEYLHQYGEALTLMEQYNQTFGPDERAEHEIAFLKSRQE